MTAAGGAAPPAGGGGGGGGAGDGGGAGGDGASGAGASTPSAAKATPEAKEAAPAARAAPAAPGAKEAAPAAKAAKEAPPAKASVAKAPPAKADRPAAAGGGETPAGAASAEPPAAPPWYRSLRAEPPSHLRAVFGLGTIGLLLLVWWFVTRGEPVDRIISPVRLPSPGEVLDSVGKVLGRDIGESTIGTLERVFVGVGLAAIVGIGAGVLAAANRGVGAALNPLVIFLRSVPMGALIPLTLMLFSDGALQKTMFLFLALVGFVLSDTLKAIMSVPERYVETAQTLGASRFQIIYKVLVPLALPDIITSLRFQFGLALGYVMLAEEINVQHGLGQMINASQRLGLSSHVYVLVILIALLAFTVDLVLRTIQRGLFSWRKDL